MSQAPEFHLQRMNNDGTSEPLILYRLGELPSDRRATRRGFSKTSLAVGAGLGALFGGCSGETAPEFRIPATAGKSTYRAHTACIFDLAISPDGQWLVTASEDGTVKVWSLHDGKLHATLKEHGSAVTCVAISPDSRWLASGSRDHTVKVWSLADGKLRTTLSGHEDMVLELAITPNGRWVVSGSADKVCRVWSLPDGKLEATIQSDEKNNHRFKVNISPDSRWVITAGAKTNIWSLPQGKLMATRDRSPSLSFEPVIAVTPGSGWVLHDSEKNRIQIWPLPNGPLVTTIPYELPFNPSIAISPDGKWVVFDSQRSDLIVWSLPEGQVHATLDHGSSFDCGCIAISPDNRWIVSGTSHHGNANNGARLWSLPDGKLLGTILGHSSSVRLLAISPDCRLLCTTDQSGVVGIWKLPEGTFLTTLFDPAANSSDAVVYQNPNGASGSSLSQAVPSGTPIPVGAVCTCNTVHGTYKAPTGGGFGSSCRCNKICTCIPVCQAHRLADEDPVVARLAEALIAAMGPDAVPYLRWAERQGPGAGCERIVALRRRLQAGESVESPPWPSSRICRRLLDHGDEVVAVMAAQMLELRRTKFGEALSPATSAGVESLLAAARRRAWHLN